MTRRVYLYAFDNVGRVVMTKHIEDEEISDWNMRRLGKWMMDTYPEPVTVYAVNNRPGLYEEFMESVKTKDFTIRIEFADTIGREGILIRA